MKLFSTLVLSLIATCSCIAINAKDPLLGDGDFLKIKPHQEGIGMFAASNLVLGNLYLYESGYYAGKISGFKADFGEHGNYYDPERGPNWWEYYYEPVVIGSPENAKVRFSNAGENHPAWDARHTLTRAQAHALISKYIKVKSHILEKVHQFVQEQFKDYFVVGIHYRGTDKVRHDKAPRVEYEEVVSIIKNMVSELQGNRWRIFVATDEADFLEHMKAEFPKRVLAADAFRSTTNKPVHHSENDPYLMGEQALVDSLLLSKTNILFRTTSNVSLWSTFFNPDLPEIMLSYKNNGPE